MQNNNSFDKPKPFLNSTIASLKSKFREEARKETPKML